jgi:hypothetical protein
VLLANPSQDADSAEFIETQPAYTFWFFQVESLVRP